MKEKALYIRLDATKHRLLSELVARWETSLSAAVERMVDQTLYQCVIGFEEPAWLAEAVESGLLPIQRCGEDDCEPDEVAVDNVVRFAGHH